MDIFFYGLLSFCGHLTNLMTLNDMYILTTLKFTSPVQTPPWNPDSYICEN